MLPYSSIATCPLRRTNMILPLLFLLLPGTLTANRQSCRFCQETCDSTANKNSAYCKCDADCQVFGDCCDGRTPPSSCPASQLPPLQDGVMLDCISSYLNSNIPVLADNEAFLMISTCPDSWMDDMTAEICTNPNFTTALPPVTNTATGIVYRNEYCALCNRVIELVAWQTNLACNQRVYELLTFQSIANIILTEPDIFQTECQMCAFQIPSIITSGKTAPPRSMNYMNMTPRSCFPRVSSCLPLMLMEDTNHNSHEDDTYALMKEKCASGKLDLVKGNISGVVYRNVDCAICNGENVTGCFELPQIITNRIPDLCFPGGENSAIKVTTTTIPFGTVGPEDLIDPPGLPFTITLSNLGGSKVSISTKSDTTSISLDCPKGTAPVGLDCRPTQCPEGYTEMGGSCSYVFPSPNIHPGSNITMENCSTGILVLNETDYTDLGNNTIILADDKSVVAVMDYDKFGRPLICNGNISFLDCPTAFVPLNELDYTDLGNDSIVYNNERVEVRFYDEYGRPLVCPNNTTITIITDTTTRLLATLPGLQELTYIGCSLSVLGTILILLTYTVFSELRTLPGVILMNLCSTVLATNLIFIAGDPAIKSYPVKELCTSLAIILHFSYLSQFAWMSIFSFEMVRKLFQARQLMADSNKTKHQFFVAYLCIGWCLPLLIITTSITLNFSIDELVLYGVDKDGQTARCWINHFEYFIITFLIPLVLSLSSNLLMFLLTTFILCRVSRDQSKLQTSNKFTLIRVWLAVHSTTGLTWIFGFVAILDQLNWVWYPFVIFNSIQGLAMFLAFLFSRKTLRLYLDLFAYTRLKNYFLISRNKFAVTRGPSKEVSISCTTHNSTEMLGVYKVESVNTNNSMGMVKKVAVDAL